MKKHINVRSVLKRERIALIDLFCFSDQRCEPINWNIVADVPPPNGEPTWPAVTQVAFRTNILAYVYLALSSIWIITSLMLIGKQQIFYRNCYLILSFEYMYFTYLG